MLSFNKTKPLVKNIYFWMVIWLFVVSYAHSFNSIATAKLADDVAFVSRYIADICISTFSLLAYLKVEDKDYKRFLLLIFISIVIELLANVVYNVLFNIININNTYLPINELLILSYTIFLMIQTFAWPYLIFLKRANRYLTRRALFTLFPYIISASIIFISIFFSGMFKAVVHNNFGVLQTINLVLEAVLFVLMSVCLSRSKNKSLSYLATGFLFLIALNMAHRFSYLLGHYYKTFDIVWLISFIVIIFGFVHSIERKDERIGFFEQNSIHVLTSAVFLFFSVFVSALFIFLEFFLSSIEANKIFNIGILQENMPSILVFIFFISVLMSKLVATYFSKPLDKISKRIDFLQNNKLDSDNICKEKYQIAEIEKLDRFILKTITQLQVANRVKSEFVMNMSHDFRTPASGIHSMAKTIYRKITDNNLKKLQKLVVDSSSQLLNLLDDVLDYSRLDNNAVKITRSEVDVKELINEVVSFVSPKVEEKNLMLKTHLPNSSIRYYSDKVLLQRILINIVSNAIKFTHEGGIDISVYEEEEGMRKNIVIKIKDTGIGIDKKYHKVIFEAFRRIETAKTSKYSGVGLGLSNVLLMLKKLGGEIFLESSSGKGSTFSIVLPNLE